MWFPLKANILNFGSIARVRAESWDSSYLFTGTYAHACACRFFEIPVPGTIFSTLSLFFLISFFFHFYNKKCLHNNRNRHLNCNIMVLVPGTPSTSFYKKGV